MKKNLTRLKIMFHAHCFLLYFYILIRPNMHKIVLLQYTFGFKKLLYKYSSNGGQCFLSICLAIQSTAVLINT